MKLLTKVSGFRTYISILSLYLHEKLMDAGIVEYDHKAVEIAIELLLVSAGLLFRYLATRKKNKAV